LLLRCPLRNKLIAYARHKPRRPLQPKTFSRYNRNEHGGIVGGSLVDRLPLRVGAGRGADRRAIMAQTHGRPLKRRRRDRRHVGRTTTALPGPTPPLSIAPHRFKSNDRRRR